jgi:mannose-6-phosphate isomerase-like protein (cupin superfamily)
MTATVARAAEIEPERTASGALVTTVLDTRGVGGRLVRRLVEVPAGAAHAAAAGPGGELWFVISGTGELDCGAAGPGGSAGAGRPVGPDQGIWVPAGANYQLRAAGPDPVRLDTVALPGPGGSGGPAGSGAADQRAGTPLVSDLGACEVEQTGDRKFRVLLGPGRGCGAATQFVGEIPPGQAPVHSHTYDEVVLILGGTGIAHVNGAQHPVAPGTCVYLPPGQQHCLENTGRDTLLVLGVFQPGGSPAAKRVAPGEAAP